MKRQKIRLPFKPIIIILIILLAFFFILGYIWTILSNSTYFTVKEVVVRGQDVNIDLSYLKGRNIFSLDLDKQARVILNSYPSYNYIRFYRILPGRIYVDFIKRKPVAYLKLYKNFTIDKTGVLFNAEGEAFDVDLPLITGLETKIFGPKAGKRYNLREIKVALMILGEAGGDQILREYKLKKIDVSNLRDISLIFQVRPKLTNNVMGFINPPYIFEAKLTAENIKNKMKILSGLMKLTEKDMGNIKYIDLRFNEPVIKLNNVK
ncbi:MAG: cell division protein FtsQ [Candidatus Omnitrophica bacterium]|nr:cell division protein FtsQ [Candidatus Omnitrophota bacterium]MBU1870297.1 cell division protein FtsQ [Candidatus Omnitrophota bacterium]